MFGYVSNVFASDPRELYSTESSCDIVKFKATNGLLSEMQAEYVNLPKMIKRIETCLSEQSTLSFGDVICLLLT